MGKNRSEAVGGGACPYLKIGYVTSGQKSDAAARSSRSLGFVEEMGLGRQCLPTPGKLPVHIFSPPLHHHRPLLQILRVIVGSFHFVALHMGKLHFYPVFLKLAGVIQDR
jgi:hypothetical protein